MQYANDYFQRSMKLIDTPRFVCVRRSMGKRSRGKSLGATPIGISAISFRCVRKINGGMRRLPVIV